MRAEAEKLPGGPTQDEVLAISLAKLGIQRGDCILDLGCGTGKVAIATSKIVDQVIAIDSRAEAIRYSRKEAKDSGSTNIEFHNIEAGKFFKTDDRVFDCAFVGGSRGIAEFLPTLATRVKRTIVVNAVLVSTLSTTIALMQDLGIFKEVVHVQVARSKGIAGSIMFQPIDPVYILVGAGLAC
jgi:cobalt-precorrin-6B (C15)-methyltransferase